MKTDLKDYRILRGISQEEASKEIGCTQAMLSMMEGEKRTLNDSAIDFYHSLGVDLGSLYALKFPEKYHAFKSGYEVGRNGRLMVDVDVKRLFKNYIEHYEADINPH